MSGKDNRNIKWWNTTDPIWLSSKEQGLKTGCSFWPGSEVWPRSPDMYLPYDGSFGYRERIDEIVSWFVKFDLDFATLYFDEPDHDGHAYGPQSDEYYETIARMDSDVGYLLDSLEAANLFESMNIIVLSDHGMEWVKDESYHVALDKYIDIGKVATNISQIGTVAHIYPLVESDEITMELYTNITNNVPHVKAFLKKDVPEQFHFSNNQRIGPLILIAEKGYVVVFENYGYFRPGHHGYNNSIESMQTIFIARGPDFPNKEVEAFENVNVYPLMCNLLKIECHKNNGSMEIVNDILNSSVVINFNLKLMILLIFSNRLFI